jgi:OTT_1508-like deaminase
VVPIPVAHSNISINLSQENILPVIFPPVKPVEQDIKLAVYDKLLKRLQEKAAEEGIEMKKGTMPILSTKANVHAECTLLAYHLQHSEINPYQYFGGSTLSCHGCGLLLNNFNLVARSLDLPQFFTRGWHQKVYLKWTCPSLLSQEQQMSLQPTDLSLDTQVRKEMVTVLSPKLAPYVHRLRPDVIRECQEALDQARKFLETGMCEYKLAHLCVLIMWKIDFDFE